MITREFKINVSNNSASSNPTIVLYKGDNGVLLNLTLQGFRFKIDEIFTIKATIFNKENGKLITQNELRLKDDAILFPIWDESFKLDKIGTYYVQMHIYDKNGNRISVPSFNIECRDTIY